jgi:TetR/AcrR family transcriptional regulator, fatty acid metabolism regulator protein
MRVPVNENEVGRIETEKRARILQAAYEICRECGVTAARMEEVASRAGVSKGTLYLFFASKEDLLLASIIESYETGLRQVYARTEGAPDPAAELERLLEGLVALLEQEVSTLRLFYEAWATVRGRDEQRERLDRFMRVFHTDRHRENAELIRRGQLAGVFHGDLSPEVMGQSIDALLNGYFFLATFDPEAAGPEALRRSFAALVRDRLCIEPARANPPNAAAGQR